MRTDVFSMLVCALIAISFGATAWIACMAPCSDLGWMPVKDLPARCLPGVVP